VYVACTEQISARGGRGNTTRSRSHVSSQLQLAKQDAAFVLPDAMRGIKVKRSAVLNRGTVVENAVQLQISNGLPRHLHDTLSCTLWQLCQPGMTQVGSHFPAIELSEPCFQLVWTGRARACPHALGNGRDRRTRCCCHQVERLHAVRACKSLSTESSTESDLSWEPPGACFSLPVWPRRRVCMRLATAFCMIGLSPGPS
jgi:hypothetical protein